MKNKTVWFVAFKKGCLVNDQYGQNTPIIYPCFQTRKGAVEYVRSTFGKHKSLVRIFSFEIALSNNQPRQ